MGHLLLPLRDLVLRQLVSDPDHAFRREASRVKRMSTVCCTGLHAEAAGVHILGVGCQLRSEPVQNLLFDQELTEQVLFRAKQLSHLTEALRAGRVRVSLDELDGRRCSGELAKWQGGCKQA
jgi:hypothetical protein